MKHDESRILVVDDDVDICSNLRDILSDLGYQVDVAHDGQSALDLVRRQHFDVVLLDFKMPGMDGLTLHREIKRLRAETVALMVTAYSEDGTAEAARAAGIWRVLSKPVDLRGLLSLVVEAVDRPLVLVVDDDRDLCENLRDLLGDAGYRVGLVHNANEVPQRLGEASHEIVLIDMKLPDGDGGEVFRRVREVNPDARTILITGAVAEVGGLVEQILAEGADAVCYKPFDVPGLLETLTQLTGASSSPDPR
jgi:CheY-like chemotaxis protein